MSSHFFALTYFVCAIGFVALPAASPAAESVEELLKKGAINEQRFAAEEALRSYLPAEKLEPKNARVLVAIARQYRYLMVDETTKEGKLRLGRIALGYSQRAAAAGPNDPEAQLAVGITYGKMLPLLGSKEQVDASPRIKKSVDAALRLDPRNDTAWHILGRWHRVLAEISGLKRMLAGAVYGGLPKGSNEEAAKALEKAITVNPNRLMHYIELGRVYAQMGRTEDARKFINKGLAMPNLEKDDPETKARGREALEKVR